LLRCSAQKEIWLFGTLLKIAKVQFEKQQQGQALWGLIIYF